MNDLKVKFPEICESEIIAQDEEQISVRDDNVSDIFFKHR